MTGTRTVLARLPLVRRRRLSNEVADVKAIALHLQGVVESMNHTVVELARVVERLNHDVRSGADASLPLFLGYADRLRLDADTSIGAAQVIEREIAQLRAVVAELSAELDRR